MNNPTDSLPAVEAPRPSPGLDAALLAAFGAAYYALAVFALGLPTQAGSPVFVWPADGLALGAMLVVARTLWVPFAGIAFVASLVAALQAGAALEAATVSALVAALEPAVLAAVLLRLAGGRVDIGTLQGLTGVPREPGAARGRGVAG